MAEWREAQDGKFRRPAMPPSGRAAGTLLQGAALKQKETLPPSTPRVLAGRCRASSPSSLFYEERHQRRFTWRRKGQELSCPEPLDDPGREEEDAGFLIPRPEHKTITREGNKSVPTLFREQNPLLSCPGTRVLSLPPAPSILPTLHSSLGHSLLSQALSFLGPEQTCPRFIHSLRHSFCPPVPPFSRAHTV